LPERGFTLLEVLTAMALFFMVAGILVSGVSQAIRVAEVGAIETAAGRDQSMRLTWFREAVGLTVLPPAPADFKDRPPSMVGNARTVFGLSLAVPNALTRGPSPYRFEIGFDADRGETVLQLFDSSRSGESSPAVLASWRGGEGRFFYLDEDDVWQEQWPTRQVLDRRAALLAKGRLVSDLPKMVELRYGDPPQSVAVAIQDRTIPPPPLSEMVK
jgi:prepilin-type N-terminal cleavage/methylation domain-containing protein